VKKAVFMDMEKQEHLEASTSVAVIAPVWLQHALLVFLHSAPELRLVACTATVQILLALDLGQTPELIIVETDKNYQQAQEQVREIKAAWPDSRIIALIAHKSLKRSVQAAGADEVLVSGTAPEQLKLAIARLMYPDIDTPTATVGENKL
jgi:DNA-binding NarL/FixJ family response regulator